MTGIEDQVDHAGLNCYSIALSCPFAFYFLSAKNCEAQHIRL